MNNIQHIRIKEDMRTGKIKTINCCLKKCCHCETSPQTGRGNPPDEWNQGTITTKKRGSSHYSWCNSEHFPSNRGIATSLRSSQ